jgi:hypothetical protein
LTQSGAIKSRFQEVRGKGRHVLAVEIVTAPANYHKLRRKRTLRFGDRWKLIRERAGAKAIEFGEIMLRLSAEQKAENASGDRQFEFSL